MKGGFQKQFDPLGQSGSGFQLSKLLLLLPRQFLPQIGDESSGVHASWYDSEYVVV